MYSSIFSHLKNTICYVTVNMAFVQKDHVKRNNYITRNEVTFLYVLLECFKWISTYFKANNAIDPYNIDSL